MWSVLANLLRRASIRGIKEGRVQKASVKVFDVSAPEQAERWQDYGFSGNPDQGEGIVIDVGGHAIIIRLDRLSSRPQLAKYEVCVWHEQGHKLTLKDGGLIEVDCTLFKVNGDMQVTGNQVVAGSATAATVVGLQDVVFAGKSALTHVHGGVQRGVGLSDPPA